MELRLLIRCHHVRNEQRFLMLFVSCGQLPLQRRALRATTDGAEDTDGKNRCQAGSSRLESLMWRAFRGGADQG